jgi:hypothetical protein
LEQIAQQRAADPPRYGADQRGPEERFSRDDPDRHVKIVLRLVLMISGCSTDDALPRRRLPAARG